MLRKLKERMNNIYIDNSVPLDNIEKRIIYMVKQRVTKEDFSAFIKLKRLKKQRKKSDGKICVVFLLQMPEVWEKQKSIYFEMRKHERIRPLILAIPQYDIQTEMWDKSDNEAYRFAKQEGLSEIVRADINGSLIDLKTLEPDYVFYQRPYEAYLPEIYRSKNVLNYARTCYVPYAVFATLAGEMVMEYERGFARNIYMNFVANDEIEHLLKKKFFLTYRFHMRKIKYLGIPILENILKSQLPQNQNKNWKEWGHTENKLKIMWTPRWTTDTKLGGSHFFDYYKQINWFAQNNKDFFILFRPHPMAFANYIKQGLMTEAEVKSLQEQYEISPNLAMDNKKEYVDTFWGSDVLITDISSMLLEYFITGKPIIFCGTNMKLNSMFKQVVDSTYQCNTWEEIEIVLKRLQNGEDVLQEKRKNTIKKLFGRLETTSEQIVQEIVLDYLQCN